MVVKVASKETLSCVANWEYEFLQLFGNFAIWIKNIYIGVGDANYWM